MILCACRRSDSEEPPCSARSVPLKVPLPGSRKWFYDTPWRRRRRVSWPLRSADSSEVETRRSDSNWDQAVLWRISDAWLLPDLACPRDWRSPADRRSPRVRVDQARAILRFVPGLSVCCRFVPVARLRSRAATRSLADSPRSLAWAAALQRRRRFPPVPVRHASTLAQPQAAPQSQLHRSG